jgi:hypothetical protein
MKDRDETRERFVAAIADQVPPDAIAEVHLFQPIKQGGTESGIAVVAVQEEQLPAGGAAAAENGPDARSASAENRSDALRASAENSPALSASAANGPARNVNSENRLAVYTAKYRLTLKGPERGKWDFAIQAEADAPLVTVDRVVQGVQRRSGDAEDPEKFSGDEFRALLPPPSGAESTQGQSA